LALNANQQVESKNLHRTAKLDVAALHATGELVYCDRELLAGDAEFRVKSRAAIVPSAG
jgi:hypothetical protein